MKAHVQVRRRYSSVGCFWWWGHEYLNGATVLGITWHHLAGHVQHTNGVYHHVQMWCGLCHVCDCICYTVRLGSVHAQHGEVGLLGAELQQWCGGCSAGCKDMGSWSLQQLIDKFKAQATGASVYQGIGAGAGNSWGHGGLNGQRSLRLRIPVLSCNTAASHCSTQYDLGRCLTRLESSSCYQRNYSVVN